MGRGGINQEKKLTYEKIVINMTNIRSLQFHHFKEGVGVWKFVFFISKTFIVHQRTLPSHHHRIPSDEDVCLHVQNAISVFDDMLRACSMFKLLEYNIFYTYYVKKMDDLLAN